MAKVLTCKLSDKVFRPCLYCDGRGFFIQDLFHMVVECKFCGGTGERVNKPE